MIVQSKQVGPYLVDIVALEGRQGFMARIDTVDVRIVAETPGRALQISEILIAMGAVRVLQVTM